RTERYLSSIAVASRESYYYPMRRIVFGEVIDALEEAGRADPELELQVQTTIKRFANAYKNADGMVWGLARNKVVARKAEEEIAFREWIAADPGLAARFDGVLDRLLALDLEEFDRQEKDFLLDQLRFRSGVVRGMIDQAMRGEEVAATTLEEARGPLASVDRRVLELLFGYADALPPTQRLAD
ncbi:MAG: S46 family peptidase, partial [Planctomycetota bacterium]